MTSLTITAAYTAETPARGQPLDFTALVNRYSRDLYRYAYWLCGDRSLAEDLVQDTLLRAWKSLHRVNEPKAIKGWLITILRRENARRFERQRPQYNDIPVEDLGSQQTSYDTSTEAFVLRQALHQLPEDYREPLMLQVLGGYSQQEIANRLGISSAGAGTRLFRARQKLRQILGERVQ
jgi:RNA polymerase sigma-70 factor (ECF subfamily)